MKNKLLFVLFGISALFIGNAFAMESSAIYSKHYWPQTMYDGWTDTMFCSRETLADNSVLCCRIGKNYTITCSLYPDAAHAGKARCISFDLGGIIGLQPENVDLKSAAERLILDSALQHHISQEYNGAYQTSKYLFHTKWADGRSLTFETFENVEHDYYSLSKDMPDGSTISDVVLGTTSADRSQSLPLLSNMIERLRQKYNLPTVYVSKFNRGPLPVTILHDEHCDQHLVEPESGQIAHHLGWWIPELILRSSLLRNCVDDQCGAMLAHELFHIKQADDWQHETGNNQEAEADLASVLVTNGPHLAAFIGAHKAE